MILLYTDTDECAVGSHVCDSDEDCENEEPFYSCFCHVREQFISQGIQCIGQYESFAMYKLAIHSHPSYSMQVIS